MSKKEHTKSKILTCLSALILAFLASIIIKAVPAFAEVVTTSGLVTDSNDVRWEYQLDEEDGEQTVYIRFYDKPSDASTIVIPSLSEVLSLVPGANQNLDTYFLDNADISAQDAAFGNDRRASNVDTTKIDMTNTSKIQIIGVQPMINPAVETELVFGENMVIGEKTGPKIFASVCSSLEKNWRDEYYCNNSVDEEFPIPGFNTMTPAELEAYTVSPSDINCLSADNALSYDPSRCYVQRVWKDNGYIGVFSGYKLKLTNFEGSNFNYVGWEAFAHSAIAGESVTISGDSFAGGNIFKNTNLKNVTIETNNIGTGIFKYNKNLETVTFADNVTDVTVEAFASTNLTSFDFSNTNIKTIQSRAFENANLHEVNFEGVESIKYRAFAGNDIYELYLPKSINDLEAYLFENNYNLQKVTVAYDTLTSGTTLQFYVVLDNNWGTSNQPSTTIKELNVIAPYAEDEPVSPTHIPYEQYKWHYHSTTREYMPEPCGYRHWREGCSSAASNDYGYTQYSAYNSDGSGPAGASGSQFETDYADVDSKKNIIAPAYFANLHGLKKITVGEGYEYIGSSAFTDWSDAGSGEGAGDVLFEAEDTGNRLYLPDSLKGIGNLAFDHLFNREYTEFTIPKNIEFIGIFAFKNVYYYDGDVDFPNLVALGDHAFEKTRTRNIHLYDKLRYMGAQVFSDCWFLNDITFDLDVFDPNIYIAWALPHRHSPDWYDGQFHITTEFGPRYPYRIDPATAEKFGIRQNFDQANNFWPMVFGTITFTDKNVSQLPNGYHNCYYFSERDTTDAVNGCPGGYYGTGIYNTFFGHINADKVDLGGTNWKILSPRMFVQTSIGEVVLPHSLEVIPGDSFSDSFIQEELVLPDTLKVIGDAAFNFGMTQYSGHPWNSQTQRYEENVEYLQNHTIHIKKLPESLEYLGNDAFYNDWGLEADLNSPNLRHIGYKAFYGTRLHDVYLPPTVKSMHAASFANISTLHDITIDFDFGALPPNYEEPFNPNDFPQSLRDFAGANIYQVLHMSCSARNMANNDNYKVTTFYSIFNQHNDFYDEHDPNNYNIILSYGQKDSQTHYGKVTFTENAQSDIYMTGTGFFSGLIFDELDLGETGWKHLIKNVPWGFEDTRIGKLTLPKGLETVTQGALQNAQIEEPFELPSTLKTIGVSAFQNTKGTYTNELPEGLEQIQYAAFYASDMTDNLVVPSTVTVIQPSAFNAGDADVHYDTITVKPENIDFNLANGQLMHQMFWQNDVDKMIIDSKTLPASVVGHTENYQEFWHMPFDELVLNNLEKVTYKACEGCSNLQKVDASQNGNLRLIDDYAFAGDENLKLMTFSHELEDDTVNIGPYAFEGTAFETMGDESTDFDLTAAKFRGLDGYAFSKMPKLRTVDVPESFSNATVPVATFANDEALTEATISYKTTLIDNAAFSNDNNLEKIFIWGNTVVRDENLEGYVAPESGFGGDNDNTDDTDADDEAEQFGPTIPERTDIYAYSANVTKDYAAADARQDFEGTFYPLDEVLYLTSNKPRVILNDDESDFDKSNLVVYGLRRDGVILQSDNWGEFDGVAYPRNDSDLVFEKMDAGIEEDPVAGAVYDTPVPMNLLSLANENFANIDFDLIRDSDDQDVRLVNIIYTDAYTGGQPDTDIDPYAIPPTPPPTPRPPLPPIPEIIETVIEGPITFVKNHFGYVVMLAACSAGLVFALKRRKQS